MPTQTKRFPQALKAVRHLKAADPVLSAIIDEAGPMRLQLDPEATLYESLARSIFYQQIHGKAAAAIMNRVKIACGSTDRFPTPQKFLSMDPNLLRAAGLSQSKLKYLTDLAERVSRNELPTRESAEQMTDQELIEAFTVVHGIGTWTVQMLLIFTLGRPDVFPVDDFGIRNGYSKVYGKKNGITPKALKPLGEKWRPYRSIASWYLWRATEFDRFKQSSKGRVRAAPSTSKKRPQRSAKSSSRQKSPKG